MTSWPQSLKYYLSLYRNIIQPFTEKVGKPLAQRAVVICMIEIGSQAEPWARIEGEVAGFFLREAEVVHITFFLTLHYLIHSTNI